jgi:phosphopantetheine adenylyltransferase
MSDQESVAEFFTRLVTLTNQMKVCGETVSDVVKIEKVLRTLTPNFDRIVVAIEESKDHEQMKLEELQGSLEVHELRVKQRSFDKNTEQALKAFQAQASKKVNSNN